MEYLIKTYTQEGETVLDFAAGSFTTGVACVNINRKFIGIELDKNYFDIGVNRIKERIKCLDLKIEPMISMGD
jgi:site-specific DNA-methyltransferase (adenine-specific)